MLNSGKVIYLHWKTIKKHNMSDVQSKVISIIVDKLGVDEGE